MATTQFRVWLTTLTIVAVPLLWTISIVVQPSMTPTRWVQRAVPLVSFALYAWFVFPWYIPGYLVRLLVVAAALCAAAIDGVRAWGGPGLAGVAVRDTAIPLAVSIGFMVVLGSTLRPGKPTPLALRNPFDVGSFAVTNGGAGWLVNGHWSVPEQRHAIDIVRIGPYGARAEGICPSGLDRYYAYDTPVVAPVRGRVAEVRDGLPDLVPGDTDRSHPEGNFVSLVDSDGVRVLLAHFRRGSIAVHPGEDVEAGHLLGHVGNSGNTTEPHLHLQANARDGEAVPIAIDGVEMRRNSRFGSGRPR